MSKPVLFQNLKQAEAAAAKLNIDTSKMRTMAQITEAINKHLSKPQMVAKPALAAKAPVISVVDNLKFAAKSARTASAKVEAYSQLVAKLHADLQAEKDFTKQASIQRDLMAAQKSEAFARLAERQQNPKADGIRRLMDAADRE